MKTEFEHKYGIGDKVLVKDLDIESYIIGIDFRKTMRGLDVIYWLGCDTWRNENKLQALKEEKQ